MQFSRVRLENWRNFSQVNVDLQTRTFLVGANASGKSNFLDVFRFLRDLVTPGGGFQEAIIKRGGVSSIRNLAARHPSTDVAIDVDLAENNEIIWQYRLVFSQKRRDHPLLKEEKIWRGGELMLNRPDKDDQADEARLSQTHLEQTFANRKFRQITEFFESISYWHIVPQLVREPERYIGRQSDPYGGDFLEQIAQVNKRSQQARLRRIQRTLKIAIPQLSDLQLERDERGVPHLRGKYEHWRPTGAWQTESEFSDGTLRLIGLLWALQDGRGPLLLEEPELSLHPGVIRYVPQMLQNVQRQQKLAPRQVIVSTHSSELLTDEGIGADETLLFFPSKEGTTIKVGADIKEIEYELNAGLTIGEATLRRTEPSGLYQLQLWND